MSFTIILEKNNSPLNKMGKDVTTIATLTGTMRNETNIVRPEIIIEATADIIKSANYLTISEFKRKYFIEDVESIRDLVWLVKARVDVLDSFEDEIKSNKAVVIRQENNFNLLLNDGVFKCQQNPRISYRDFPSGLGQFNYILITQGGRNGN